ncbi:tRNA-splicing endonuclease subunit Sen2-1-like [Durio zibethinus]|uniref:tRNA-intron lyase n=1 Tax=Durio zibethinus TaxID=66656 RepID=A0A6P5XVG6_DURZI|nr:tRNA-splicing endonuclease subunit Sen2-1-like [Durio zibethinus]XP_022732204.1 tRNA-splicing endonuclease subunit Sen2-1-like [Durio zibethinus]XP_022732206.1 tRNA-splicing endonuclease subunit Sen2-1-like [Durio zibethinus]XP_022732207.1 tRNA-splicing endonuclease subunit Sen2-1-like [Durio zibethinus]XP_022732208.1 tRNA-splicing endonuclease subunit Sen2-1-like [Durio zibethinus]
MKPRWKGKGSEAKAMADPMSMIVSQLQSFLIQSETRGLLSSCSVLVEVDAELADLLNRACFGRPRITAEKDKQWFQLDMEEAFYLCFSLKCLKVVGEDGCIKSNEELWGHWKSKKVVFPVSFKAYSHLRHKNWIVRSGLQYGVDFVAYRHHPALVHSEYAVLAVSEGNNDQNGRLRGWSDVHCTVRLCGSVAKTLLIVIVNNNSQCAISPSCLEHYTVEERTITRWNPEQSREDQEILENRAK